MDTEEAARFLGVSARRIRQLAEAGKIGQRVGARTFAFTREELEEYALTRRPPGRPRKDDNPPG